ncbi:MAG: DUF3426 domain-containing protein [Geobacter sp.]|nr:DUF3426 domain-containing protein [Geobacter sp.]
MIIQCEQCRTKFKLDDERVSDKGVKVRCAKCRNVFVVRKDLAQAAAPTEVVPDLAAVTAPPVVAADETVRMSFTPAPEPEVAAFAAEPEVAFDFGATPEAAAPEAAASFDFGQADAAADSGFDFGDVSFTTEAPAAAPAAVDFGEMTMVMPKKQTAEQPVEFGFDFSDATPAPSTVSATDTATFDFGDAFTAAPDSTAQKSTFDFGDQGSAAVPETGEIDLGGFDFGDAPAAASVAPTSIAATDFSDFTAATSPKSAGAESSFSFDEAAPQPAAASVDGFDFSGVDFSEGKTPAPATPQVDTFSLNDMDFSSDTAAVAVDATATAPAGSTLFAPVEESVARQQEPAKPDISFEAPAGAEEQPPLPITSRRRQSSTLSILIGIITVLVLAVLGYVAYTFIGGNPSSLSIFGKGSAPVEDGRITVQNVKAYFIPKAAAGELLVITGEALNGYTKPRAALQLKGMVYGANNQAVATKTAYAGNLLTREQLTEMPAEKIEATMNNQFGDSLTNLEVQPGKTIPFTIIIINPPKDGNEFGVEPVGSTVATTGK